MVYKQVVISLYYPNFSEVNTHKHWFIYWLCENYNSIQTLVWCQMWKQFNKNCWSITIFSLYNMSYAKNSEIIKWDRAKCHLLIFSSQNFYILWIYQTIEFCCFNKLFTDSKFKWFYWIDCGCRCCLFVLNATNQWYKLNGTSVCNKILLRWPLLLFIHWLVCVPLYFFQFYLFSLR